MTEKDKAAFLSEAVELLYGECELWLSTDKEIFISFQAGTGGKRHWENWPLHSREAEGWIRMSIHATMKKILRKADIEECKLQLEAAALSINKQEPACLRIAMLNGHLYVDLGLDDWSVVEITPQGWDIIANPPVKFRRAPNMLPMAIPERGGSIELLRDELNTKNRRDFLLMLSWLIGCFDPFGPYTILTLTGRAGSAKSTAARTLLSYVNASQAPTQGAPKSEHDLMVMAENNVAICFDNSGEMQRGSFLPNALCRLSTGGGLSMRTLYSNKGMTFFGGARPVIITAISQPCKQTDFIDRSIKIELPPIPKGMGMRKTERNMRKESKGNQGKILGAIFDILSTLLGNLDQIDSSEYDLPRMSDFAYWILCAEEAIGWKKGEFLEYLAINRAESFNQALDGDVLAIGINKLVAQQEKWEGTSSELITKLADILDTEAGIPENPAVLSAELNKLAVAFSDRGIEIETGIREGGGKRRLVRIAKSQNCDAVTPKTASLLPNKPEVKIYKDNGQNAVTPSQIEKEKNGYKN